MAAPEDLLDHLQRSTRLSRDEAERLVAEILAYFADEPADWVARRHGELQARGLRNAEIFERIRGELRERRFAAPALSERQIRRLIYG